MLRGYRGIVIAVIGWLIAAPALWLLIGDLATVSRSYERSASDASRYYADHAEREIRQSCPRLPPELQNECVSKAESTARENQRSEQDLAAQKVTAWWTQIMGGAALIGMALSALGVALVWTTFREQQRATNIAQAEAERARIEAAENAASAQAALEAARESANAASRQAKVAERSASLRDRPYILLDTFTYTPQQNLTLGSALYEQAMEFRIKVINFGATPAINMSLYGTKGLYAERGKAVPSFSPYEPEPVMENSLGPTKEAITNPFFAVGADLNRLLQFETTLYLYGRCTYSHLANREDAFSIDIIMAINYAGEIVKNDGARGRRFVSTIIKNQIT